MFILINVNLSKWNECRCSVVTTHWSDSSCSSFQQRAHLWIYRLELFIASRLPGCHAFIPKHQQAPPVVMPLCRYSEATYIPWEGHAYTVLTLSLLLLCFGINTVKTHMRLTPGFSRDSVILQIKTRPLCRRWCKASSLTVPRTWVFSHLRTMGYNGILLSQH